MPDPDPYRDRLVLITGAGSGIGLALAVELGRRGAVVGLADLDGAAAARGADRIVEAGGRAFAERVDVAVEGEVASLVTSAIRAHGPLALMVNSAGLGQWGPFDRIGPDQWEKIVKVNICGVLNGTRAAYAAMLPRRRGSIVNIASLAGLVPVPGTVAYAMTKHAVVGLSTSLRPEAAAHGVGVSVACPGPVATPFHDALLRAGGDGSPRRAPRGSIAPELAARLILEGVDRGRGVIVLPGRARRTWLRYRLFPASFARLHRRMVGRLRSAFGGAASAS